MITSKSIVLKTTPDEDELYEGINRLLQQWGTRFGIYLSYEDTLNSDVGITTFIWKDFRKPGLEIRLIFDEIVPMTYFSVNANTYVDADTLLDDLKKNFPSYCPEELWPEVFNNHGDIAAWTRLAISMNGQQDPLVESLLVENLISYDNNRLNAAAVAAALLRWPSLVEPLKSLLTRSLPPELKRAINLALLACIAHKSN